MPKSILKSRKLRKFLFSTSSPGKNKNKNRPRPNHNSNISLNEIVERKSYQLINLAGYTILALVFFDYLTMFIPPKLFNPSWELETIGKAVEIVWGPLLGLILVFYRRQQDPVKRGELKLLSLFSWLALILGIVYLLAAPLLITNTFRIMGTNHAQMARQLETQNNQVEQFSQQLERASDNQLGAFWLKYQWRTPEFSATSPQEIKQTILQKIDKEKQKTRETVEQNFAKKRLSLVKMTVKWVLGTLIAGISFITIWKHTRWTRAFGK